MIFWILIFLFFRGSLQKHVFCLTPEKCCLNYVNITVNNQEKKSITFKNNKYLDVYWGISSTSKIFFNIFGISNSRKKIYSDVIIQHQESLKLPRNYSAFVMEFENTLTNTSTYVSATVMFTNQKICNKTIRIEDIELTENQNEYQYYLLPRVDNLNVDWKTKNEKKINFDILDEHSGKYFEKENTSEGKFEGNLDENEMYSIKFSGNPKGNESYSIDSTINFDVIANPESYFIFSNNISYNNYYVFCIKNHTNHVFSVFRTTVYNNKNEIVDDHSFLDGKIIELNTGKVMYMFSVSRRSKRYFHIAETRLSDGAFVFNFTNKNPDTYIHIEGRVIMSQEPKFTMSWIPMHIHYNNSIIWEIFPFTSSLEMQYSSIEETKIKYKRRKTPNSFSNSLETVYIVDIDEQNVTGLTIPLSAMRNDDALLQIENSEEIENTISVLFTFEIDATQKFLDSFIIILFSIIVYSVVAIFCAAECINTYLKDLICRLSNVVKQKKDGEPPKDTININ